MVSQSSQPLSCCRALTLLCRCRAVGGGRAPSLLVPALSSSLRQHRVCQPGEQGAPRGIEASVPAGCCLSVSLSSPWLLCSVLPSSCSSLSWQHSFSTSPCWGRERHAVSPQPEAAALHSPSAAQDGSRRPLCRGWLVQELRPVVSLHLLRELLAVICAVRAMGSSPRLSHHAVVSRTALGTL